MKIQRINRSKQRKQKSFSVVPQGWFAAKPLVNTSRGDNCERPLSPWLNISASSLVSGSVVAVLLFLLSGCAVGPNYRAPQTKAPAQWNESLAGGETNSSAASTEWWKNFHDSELDSLIERAVRSDLDLRIAQARVREARAQYGIASADLWPTVDGSSSYARQRQSKHQPLLGSFPFPPGVPFENDVYQAGFDASWEIDVFGGKRRAKEAAGAQVSASEFGRRDVLITLLGDVRETMWSCVATKDDWPSPVKTLRPRKVRWP